MAGQLPRRPTLTPLGPGEYPLTLSDAFGCDIQWVLPLTQPDSLYISGAAISPASDSISADGSVSVMPAGGTAAYTGMWAGGQSGLSITNLPPATYTLTLTDAHGCSLTATYVVGVVSSTVSPAALVAVRVWPNPFEEVLRVSVDAELGLPAGAVLRLRDVQGREVAHWRLGGGEQAVQVPVLPAGVYGWEVVFSPEKDDVVARGWLVRE